VNLYRFGTILFIFLWSVALIDLTKTKLFPQTLDRDHSFHDLSNDHYLGLLDRLARNRSLHNWFPELLWSFVEILIRLVFHLDPIDNCSRIVSLVVLPLSLWFKFSFSVEAFRSVDTYSSQPILDTYSSQHTNKWELGLNNSVLELKESDESASILDWRLDPSISNIELLLLFIITFKEFYTCWWFADQ